MQPMNICQTIIEFVVMIGLYLESKNNEVAIGGTVFGVRFNW